MNPFQPAVLASLFAFLGDAAIAQFIPMTAILTVPQPEVVNVDLLFDQNIRVDVACFYTAAAMSAVVPGGEGGCINLPGGVPLTERPNWQFSINVPNATALCGLQLLVLAAQASPLLVGAQVTTVTCG